MATKKIATEARKNWEQAEWNLDMQRDQYNHQVNGLAEQEERAALGLPALWWTFTQEAVDHAEARLIAAIELHAAALDAAVEAERAWAANPRARR